MTCNKEQTSYLVVYFLAWLLGLLVLCRDIDLIPYSKVYLLAVSVNVGLFLGLCPCHKLPTLLDGLVYPGSQLPCPFLTTRRLVPNGAVIVLEHSRMSRARLDDSG